MSPLSRVAVLALCAALLVFSGAGLVAGGSSAQQVTGEALPTNTQQVSGVELPPDAQQVSGVELTTNTQQVTPETLTTNTTITIGLNSTGDARWTVSMTVPLDDETDVEAFRSIGDAFEAGESDVLSIETFRRFADLASRATGREMSLREVTHNATVSNETGRLKLGFTWQNFASRDGSSLEVGDVFASPSGTWLDGLTATQRLVIESPPSSEITSAPKEFSNRTIHWTGPTSLDPSSLSITYRIETTPSGPGGGFDLQAMALVVLITGAVFGLYMFRQRSPIDVVDLLGGSVPGSAHRTDDSEPEPEPPTDGDEPDGAEIDSSEEETAEDEDENLPVDRELLSDEEYVEALIEHNGGRMKQAAIVEETDWSNAKVSQLLSAMAEDGHIEKLRIGRENLISFPEDEHDEP
ncbi:helix-turn-helix transcriptional regulator [Halorhabdus amylolytica]|uniref:helix-turn-helix transcriptional regulator n=1 Tax=Halorhabdus amylolytica TaxID=2559573 RepID=UPI0010AAEA14|nr:hypothetical protein [Halorhabdus amylolytica]